MTALAWVAAFAVVLLAAVTISWCVSRARRLNRLHVRTDAARAALLAALRRRARAAHRAAGALHHAETRGSGDSVGPAVPDGVAPDAADLDRAARRALAAQEADREAAENDLGRRLGMLTPAALPTAVAHDLVDADQLVILARHVHNDAVRDALALRSRRLVRWLRLAGRAPEPEYFDIIDAGGPAADRADPRGAAATAPRSER